MASTVKKKTKGRQKLPMVKISNEFNRQVTFSKRRHGLFKKASELATLCGADIAVIVFSPGKSAFSFGQPSVGSVLSKFLAPASVDGAENFPEASRNASVSELNTLLTQVLKEVEFEKNRAQELKEVRRAGCEQWWWEAPFDDLSLEQLKHLRKALIDLRTQVSITLENAETEALQKLLQSQPPVELLPYCGMNGYNFRDGGPFFH